MSTRRYAWIPGWAARFGYSSWKTYKPTLEIEPTQEGLNFINYLLLTMQLFSNMRQILSGIHASRLVTVRES